MRRPGRLPPHIATTATLQGAYPFLASAGQPIGSYIGQDLHGGPFCYDPFDLYAEGELTNPNMLILGSVGSAKSSLVKTFLLRQQVPGRTAWIADPKGEYGALAAALGVRPIRLGPGLAARLNPFDVDSTSGADAMRQRTHLLAALAATTLGRPLEPVEHAACDLAVARCASAGAPLLPELVDALFDPTTDDAAGLRVTPGALADRTRDVALALRRLCYGDLAGLFDAPTTVRPAPTDPLVVVDLSAIYQQARDALPLALTCTTAWLQQAIGRTTTLRRYVVLDEAWALLSHLPTAQWLQQSFKLARAHGIANIVILHRASDLTAVADAGSHAVSLARGLLADTGVRVLYQQAPEQARLAADLLGLTSVETELLPHLAPGVALWQLGDRTHLVAHQLADDERPVVDTNQRMIGDR